MVNTVDGQLALIICWTANNGFGVDVDHGRNIALWPDCKDSRGLVIISERTAAEISFSRDLSCD